MPSYCTLRGARRQLMADSVNPNISDVEDAVLFSYIQPSSQEVEDFCGYNFDERIETHYFSARRGKSPELGLDDWPLISIDELTNGDGSVISSSSYTLLPRGEYPKKSILLSSSGYWLGPDGNLCNYSLSSTDRTYGMDAISVRGKWGYHRNYPRAWKKIAVTLGANLDDTSEEVTLSANAGLTLDVGNVIRVDTEYMLIVGPLDQSEFMADSITVERAYNGSTAAEHADEADIYVWQVEPVIQLCTEMSVAANYVGRNNATGDRQVVEGIGAISIPVDIPGKVKGRLASYKSHHRGRL